jgi:hypothetical protein
MTEDMGDAPYI